MTLLYLNFINRFSVHIPTLVKIIFPITRLWEICRDDAKFISSCTLEVTFVGDPNSFETLTPSLFYLLPAFMPLNVVLVLTPNFILC